MTNEIKTAGQLVKEKIIKMIIDLGLTGDRRNDFALLVSMDDTRDLENYLQNGFLGESLRNEYYIKGLVGTLPHFLGFLVIWASDEVTSFQDLSALTQSQLLKVIKKQKLIINNLWEHRQRL